MSNLKVKPDKLKSLPAQIKYPSDDLIKVKINQNSTYGIVSKLKDRSS